MSTLHEPKTRQEIQHAFDQLLRRHQARASQISTKAEEAEARKHRELVENAAAYTVESIVNGLAKLQLGFGRAVDEIAAQLDEESSKRGQLRRAIEVERARLEQLEGTVVAAETLAILEQDHRRSLAELDEQVGGARKTLGDERVATREGWQRQEDELARAAQAHAELQAKQRQQAEEERAYELARVTQVEADERAAERQKLERELGEQEAAKAKDWAAREKVLDEDAARIEELRTKVAGFPEALDKAAKEAREKAIASLLRDAKHENELLEKQQRGDIKVFELKVQTLEQRIARQAALIEELGSKLDHTIAKSQDLAAQAFHPHA